MLNVNMNYPACIGLIIMGLLSIWWGYIDFKKKGDDATHTNKGLIFFGAICILLALLGIFNIIPWTKE